MKKILLVLTIGLTMFLVSCTNYDKTSYYFADYRVYYLDHGACEMFIQDPIFEDENSIYYLTSGGCSAGHYYFIKSGNTYIDIADGIENGIITIDDVIESEIPALMIEDK